jgi:hypothetical protein
MTRSGGQFPTLMHISSQITMASSWISNNTAWRQSFFQRWYLEPALPQTYSVILVVTVIFIPKSRCTSYVQVRSFCHISPNSFLSKTLDRFVDSCVRDRASVEYPLHSHHKHIWLASLYRQLSHNLVCKTDKALKGGLSLWRLFFTLRIQLTIPFLGSCARKLRRKGWSNVW